jgi:carnitine O-palmitoyltransferase 1
MRTASENFDLAVTSTLDEGGPGYGKDFIKKCSVSPDAYVQSALQLAYFRDTKATEGVGKFEATYESSMTRMFLHGRTETVRPVTGDMCAFVRAMEDEGCPPADKLKALQRAAETHVTQFQNAMIGQGIDRHLFGLFCVSVAMGVDSPFLKAALSAPWKLSTSQQPQQQTELWDIKNKAWEDRISPGGGFGPVSPEGYGVSYMVSGEKEIFFHISAMKSVEGKPARTNVQRFRANLFGALTDMKKILSLATAAPSSGGAGGEKKKA